MAESSEITALKINASRLGTINEVAKFLHDLESAYNSLYAFDLFLYDHSRHLYSKNRRAFFYEFGFPPFGLITPNVPTRLIQPQYQLTLSRINIQSPGFWEVVGSLNPIQQIREYLKDRHERRKDREWREQTEREKAILENQLLERQIMSADNNNLNQRIQILRELGFSESQIRELIWANVGQPLNTLGKHQDTGLIEDAE